jgi:hypothetical protein
MRYRKLRIAWSVGWGIVCLLLIVLWVRSYWWMDSFDAQLAQSRPLYVTSRHGGLQFSMRYDLLPDLHSPGYWHYSQLPVDHEYLPWTWFEFHVSFPCDNFDEIAPHWLFSLVAALCAAMPWLRFRFSLRALLIATTLVAVLLGVVVWFSR